MNCNSTYEDLEQRVKDLEKEKKEHKLIEEEFIKRQKYLESVLHHAPDAIVTLDPSHRILEWNPGAQLIFGYSSDEAIGRDLDDLVSRQDVEEEAHDKTSTVLSGQILKPVECVRYRKDGTSVNVIASGAPIIIDNVLKGVVAMYTDISYRKHVEDELQKRETTLKTIFDAAPVGICIMKNRVYKSANRNWCESFGYPEEYLIGKTTEFLYESHEEYERVGKKLFKNLLKKGRVFAQVKLKRSDGELRDVNLIVQLLNLHGSGTDTVVVVAHDITDFKNVEEALRRNESQLRTIIEHTNELFFIHDTKHFLTYVSPTSEVILGYSPEELKRKWTELVTDNPINLKGVENTENAIKTGKKQKPYLLELKKKDGTLILGEVDESPVRNAIGEIVAISGALRDVTLKKQTESKLIKSEQRFRDLFNGIHDIIYTQDLKGCFTSVNPALCEAFGYEEDELIGRSASDYMKPEFVFAFKTKYMEQLKRIGYQEGTTIYFNKNGEKLYLEYKSSLIQPEDNEPFISGIARDVTEKILSKRKVTKLQEQIAQSQKMETIGTLAGGIAHDFNNILFPIVGHIEMLLEDVSENSSLRSSLEKIYTSVLRAKDLVKQILTFSRQDSNELQLMKIQPIIKEVLKLIRSTIPTTIEIMQDIDDDCGAIKSDPTQVHQIVMNLATNAYHAMDETGGKLKVSLKEIELSVGDLITPEMIPGVYAHLTITDTGVGMDKALTEKIFDPFFTTKEIGKGTGMGLSVVHGIVVSLGGGILVNSEPEKGSKFHIFLPVVNSSSEEQEVHQLKGSIQRGTEQILVVDDEEEILIMEKQMLERMGYQVNSNISSLEALEIFRGAPDKFDMVVSDMAMPNMSGVKLSAELIKIRPDIPILLCTGYSETMSEEKAVSLGIKGFLMKPIRMNDLSRKIREVLDKN